MDLSRTTYRIMNAAVLQSGSLVDGGSNGGLAGDDCRILEQSLGQVVDVSGINIQTRLSPYLLLFRLQKGLPPTTPNPNLPILDRMSNVPLFPLFSKDPPWQLFARHS